MLAGTLTDRYELESLLEDSTHHQVWAAIECSSGRRVAVRVPRGGPTLDEQTRRLRREAEVLCRVLHPNLLAVYDHDAGPSPFVISEACGGETVASLLSAQGALGVVGACDLAMQVLAGLEAAHRSGWVHVDLRPANVLVVYSRNRPLVKLTNFGLAQPLGGVADPSHVTEVGAFASPELVEGRPLTARSDVFAVGTLLYTMLAGVSPFEGGSPEQTLSNVTHLPPRPLTELAEHVPEALENILLRVLSRDPECRPDSARDLQQDLAFFARRSRPPVAASSTGAAVPLVRRVAAESFTSELDDADDRSSGVLPKAPSLDARQVAG